MRLKIFGIIVGLFTTLISILSLTFVTAKKNPETKSVKTILFKNTYAALLLEENPTIPKEFLAYLRVSAQQCSGSLAKKGDGGTPAKGFLKTGTLADGTLEIDQSPTMGEAACNIELQIKNNEIIAATQKGGDCDAWHGKSCGFSTPTLGGMRR